MAPQRSPGVLVWISGAVFLLVFSLLVGSCSDLSMEEVVAETPVTTVDHSTQVPTVELLSPTAVPASPTAVPTSGDDSVLPSATQESPQSLAATPALESETLAPTQEPPTATRETTLTPSPAAQLSCVVAVGSLALREGPATDCSYVSQVLRKGTELEAVNRNTDGDWIELKTEDETRGWALASFLLCGDTGLLPVLDVPTTACGLRMPDADMPDPDMPDPDMPDPDMLHR